MPVAFLALTNKKRIISELETSIATLVLVEFRCEDQTYHSFIVILPIITYMIQAVTVVIKAISLSKHVDYGNKGKKNIRTSQILKYSQSKIVRELNLLSTECMLLSEVIPLSVHTCSLQWPKEKPVLFSQRCP